MPLNSDGDSSNINADVCVLGGGIVGLTFARLLQQQCPDWKITVLDGGNEGEDGTSVVVNTAIADVLRSLAALPADSRPIKRVRLSFAGGGRQYIEDGDVLGFGIAHKTVQTALAQGVKRITYRAADISEEEESVIIRGENGECLRARALVVTCAVPFLPPAFRFKTLNYRQTILSFAATAEDCPDADAFQHFGENGVAVMVPRTDGNVGVILCATPAAAGNINALPDSALSTHLHKEFQLRLHPLGRRFAYCPRLVRATPLACRRIALIGQAATMLHPIGAQGLSMGVADAQHLAATLADDDIITALQTYARIRLSTHCKTATLTSTLALGVPLCARPFRLLGGALAAAFTLPTSQKILLSLAKASH